MRVALALCCVAQVLAQSSSNSSGSSSPSSSPSDSQASLAESVTNDYYTPKSTFTPVTTYQTAQQGHPTTMEGVGPSTMPNSYTWVYTVPDSTVPGPANKTMTSVLEAQGHTSGASDLQPAPGALQTAPGVGDDASAIVPTVGIASWLLVALWALS